MHETCPKQTQREADSPEMTVRVDAGWTRLTEWVATCIEPRAEKAKGQWMQLMMDLKENANADAGYECVGGMTPASRGQQRVYPLRMDDRNGAR